MCKSIGEGGLGIHTLKSNRPALLIKTRWKYLSNESLLCSKIIKVKYFPTQSYGKQNAGKEILDFGRFWTGWFLS